MAEIDLGAGYEAPSRGCLVCRQRFYGRYHICGNCYDKVTRLLDQGFTPAKIAINDNVLKNTIEQMVRDRKRVQKKGTPNE